MLHYCKTQHGANGMVCNMIYPRIHLFGTKDCGLPDVLRICTSFKFASVEANCKPMPRADGQFHCSPFQRWKAKKPSHGDCSSSPCIALYFEGSQRFFLQIILDFNLAIILLMSPTKVLRSSLVSASSQSEPLIVWFGSGMWAFEHWWAPCGKKTVMTCTTLKFEWWSPCLHMPSVSILATCWGWATSGRSQGCSHQVSICFIFIFDRRLVVPMMARVFGVNLSCQRCLQGLEFKVESQQGLGQLWRCSWGQRYWIRACASMWSHDDMVSLCSCFANRFKSFFWSHPTQCWVFCFVSVMCKQHHILTFRWKVLDSEMQSGSNFWLQLLQLESCSEFWSIASREEQKLKPETMFCFVIFICPSIIEFGGIKFSLDSIDLMVTTFTAVLDNADELIDMNKWKYDKIRNDLKSI